MYEPYETECEDEPLVMDEIDPFSIYRGQIQRKAEGVQSEWRRGMIVPAPAGGDQVTLRWEGKTFQVWADTLGQCTGKEDDYGWTLYEHDILEIQHRTGDRLKTGVLMNDGGARFYVQFSDQERVSFWDFWKGNGPFDEVRPVKIRRIGNIFDNPDRANIVNLKGGSYGKE